MSLPFREDDDPGRPGLVAHLRIIPESAGRAWNGGLLVVNRIGEPVELIHVRMTVPPSSLCNRRLTDHACALLLRALLERCRSAPDAVSFRPDEINEAVLRERIMLDVPLTPLSDSGGAAPPRVGGLMDGAGDASLRLETAMAAIAAEAAPP